MSENYFEICSSLFISIILENNRRVCIDIYNRFQRMANGRKHTIVYRLF